MEVDMEEEDEEGASKETRQTYRQCMKIENAQKYRKYLDDQKRRAKDYREKVKEDPDKLKRQKQLAKERQRRYREKKKNIRGEIPSTATERKLTTSVVKTRTRIEAERKQWRESKRKYRQKMTAAKKSWIQRKDRERKKQKRIKNCRQESYTRSQEESEGYENRQSLYNLTHKARKILPKSPKKFASVIKHLVIRSTPKKRKAVDKLLSPSPAKKLRTNEKDEATSINNFPSPSFHKNDMKEKEEKSKQEERKEEISKQKEHEEVKSKQSPPKQQVKKKLWSPIKQNKKLKSVVPEAKSPGVR